MEIKRTSRKPPWLRRVLDKLHGRRARALVLLAGAVFFFGFGAWSYRSGWLKGLKDVACRFVDCGVDQMVAEWRAKPKTILIDVKHLDWQKVVAKRRAALERGLLVTTRDDFVRAKIRFEDRTLKARLRLKGDLDDHWSGEKWSLRVVLRGEETLFGMQRFSVQSPQTRNNLYEWVYHRSLAREGLLGLRYDFVDVVLNGKPMGIYALEEHFGKEILEHHGRRDGPILKFNENLNWLETSDPRVWGRRPPGSGSFLASEVDSFQSGRWLATPERRAVWKKAVTLLEAFRRGELPASRVFDVERMARYLAIEEITGGLHATNWRNIRFYYDPIAARLEPIGFDAGGATIGQDALIATTPVLLHARRDEAFYYHSLWFERLFSDPVLFERYIAELERVSEEAWLTGLLAEIEEEMGEKLAILHTEDPDVTVWVDRYRANQRYARAVLDPAKPVHAYLNRAPGRGLVLRVGNLQYLPVEIVSVVSGDEVVARPRAEDRFLAGRNPAQPVICRAVGIVLDELAAPAAAPDLELVCRIRGASKTRRVRVAPWPYAWPEAFADDPLRKETDLAAVPYLVVDEEGGTVRFRTGSWTVGSDLVIPAGYEVAAGADTTLTLTDGARIISRSPLRFLGAEERPVRIVGAGGQGLLVLDSGVPSEFEHVEFTGLRAPSAEGWALPGAVNFYRSPVRLTRCRFIDNHAEDALNVVCGDIEIDRCLFEGSSNDALHVDFGRGTVRHSSFVRCGDDAVEVSGGALTLEDVTVRGAGGRGLSAAENSEVRGTGLSVTDAEIGVVARDLAHILLAEATLTRCGYGLVAFQRKSELGPGRIQVNNLHLDRVGTLALKEMGSRIRHGETWVEEDHPDVAGVLRPDEVAGGH